jgi:hypothetical protein
MSPENPGDKNLSGNKSVFSSFLPRLFLPGQKEGDATWFYANPAPQSL